MSIVPPDASPATSYSFQGSIQPLWGSTLVEVIADAEESVMMLQVAARRARVDESNTALTVQFPWAMLVDETRLSLVVARQHFSYPGLDLTFVAEKEPPHSPYPYYNHIPEQDGRTRLNLSYHDDWVSMQVPMRALKEGKVMLTTFHPISSKQSMVVGTVYERPLDGSEDMAEGRFCNIQCDVPHVSPLPIHCRQAHTATVVGFPSPGSR